MLLGRLEREPCVESCRFLAVKNKLLFLEREKEGVGIFVYLLIYFRSM